MTNLLFVFFLITAGASVVLPLIFIVYLIRYKRNPDDFFVIPILIVIWIVSFTVTMGLFDQFN